MPPAKFSRHGRIAISCAVIVAAIMAVYGGLVDHSFHPFDDPIYVTNNYYVQQGISAEGTAWAFRSLEGANWHPLTWLSHMLDIEVFGPKPAGHYLTNIFLHAVGSLLLFWLVRKIAKHDWMSLAIALIWAVHPANVECVAWISQRKSLLSSCLMFTGMLLYIYYKKSRRRDLYLFCVAAQLLASMSKPIAVIFPVALVLLDGLDEPSIGIASITGYRPLFAAVYESSKVFIIRLADKIPFVLIAAYLSVMTFIAQDKAGATGYTYISTLSSRCKNALEAIFDYTIKSLTMPESSVLYVLRPPAGLRVFYGSLLLVLFVLAAIASLKKIRAVAVGIAWYLLMFLPTIGLIQVGSQRLADRYLNLPLIGLIGIICYCLFLVFRSMPSRVLTFVALGAWSLGLGFQARALCINWGDELRLSEKSMAVGGHSSSMLLNCSVVMMQRGQYAQARYYLSIIADEKMAIQNLMVLDLYEKKYENVIKRAQNLYGSKEARLSAAIMAGKALTLMGKHADATRAYKAAINFLPRDRSYLLNVEQLKVILPLIEAASEQSEKEQNAAPAGSAAPGVH